MTVEEKAKAYDDALKRASHVKGYKTLTPKEAAEYIFPQLHESEDERIRKAIVATIEQCPDDFLNPKNRDRMLDWLEKQKDHFRDDTKMIEQKPEDDKAFEEWIDDWWKHNKVNNPDSYDKGDEIQFDEQSFKNFCRGIRNMYQQKPTELEWPNLQNCIRNCKKCHGRCLYRKEPYEENQPAKWSKNDTVFLNEITDFFENKTVRLQHDLNMYAHWLKSLPERFSLEPKQEWSEADEDIRDTIIRDLKRLGGDIANVKPAYKKEIAWLKSLRPRSKEELAKMLQEEYNKGKEEGERIGHTKGYNKGYKDAEEAYNKAVSYHP